MRQPHPEGAEGNALNHLQRREGQSHNALRAGPRGPGTHPSQVRGRSTQGSAAGARRAGAEGLVLESPRQTEMQTAPPAPAPVTSFSWLPCTTASSSNPHPRGQEPRPTTAEEQVMRPHSAATSSTWQGHGLCPQVNMWCSEPDRPASRSVCPTCSSGASAVQNKNSTQPGLSGGTL